MIKCILTDMDGTILNSQGEISLYTKNILQTALNNNITLAVASGRFFQGIDRIFNIFDNDIIYTCNNGSWIENSSRTKVYHKSIFSNKEIEIILDLIRSHTDSGYYVCTSDYGITDKYFDYIIEELKISDSRLHIEKDLLTIKEDITKITICILEGVYALYDILFNILGDNYALVISGDIWLDIIKKDASKANAVYTLEKELNIKPEEIIVFGDFDNDVPMLELCPNSYAMKNASNRAKKAANFTADSNDNDGVAKIVTNILDLKF